MSQDLELQIVLETLLKAQGFEDAQKGLKQLSDATNQASVETASGAKKSGDALKDLGGKRGGIADLTRVILMNSGATGVAGEAAKAAGIGISFMGTAATGLSFAMAGATFGIALLLPMLIQWLSHTKDQDAVQKSLTESLKAAIPDLEEYARTVKNASEELKALADLQKKESFREQKKAIADLTETINKNREEADRLSASYTKITATRYGDAIRDTIPPTQEARAKAEELTKANEELTIKLNALLAAQEDGTVLGRQVVDAVNRERKAREDLARSIAKQKQEQERLDALEKKSITEASKLRTERNKAAADEKKQAAENINIAARAVFARDKATGAILKQTKAAVQGRKEQQAADAEHLASSASYYLSFFGQNKAVRIAQALADTYAAATRALAELGPIAGPIVAAVITAQGLSNVANIQKTDVGFDDPFSDLVAAKLGRKSAVDFVNNFGAGFQSGLGMRGGGGGGTTVNNQNGMSINNLHMSGIIAGNETELLKQLNRKLIRVQRLENRTRIGA